MENIYDYAINACCTACDKQECEYITSNIYETLTGELIRVPGLLLLRCRACGALRVPPFEISKTENAMSNIGG